MFDQKFHVLWVIVIGTPVKSSLLGESRLIKKPIKIKYASGYGCELKKAYLLWQISSGPLDRETLPKKCKLLTQDIKYFQIKKIEGSWK